MLRNKIISVFVGTMLLMVIQPAHNQPAYAVQGNCQTFKETGKAVCGKFLDYWQKNGALPQQGYPISGEFTEISDLNGKSYMVQYFERAVFELHTENQPPYDVLLSQLGTFRYRTYYAKDKPVQIISTSNPRLFPETGHSVGGRFRAYWEQHGGLPQQGYPISDEIQEKSDLDGKSYMVQYFERAVFELHTENQPPYDVLLSQLGTFRQVIRQARDAASQLPSPLRTYEHGPKGSGAWPSDTGSTTIFYSLCGTQPGGSGGGKSDSCRAPMILTTSLKPSGGGFEVTFSAVWGDPSHKHEWRMQVSPQGSVTLIKESGDSLPEFPL